MKFTHLMFVLLFLFSYPLIGQENIKSFDFKKGEVMDIILLTQTSNAKELFDRYKATAFPVAFEYTYQPQPGFSVSRLNLGTLSPQAFLFGKWANLEKRQGFLSNISKRVPDFHHQRSLLFPYFGLTYYEMKRDLHFTIDNTKHNVVTAFWASNDDDGSHHFNHWTSLVEDAGGQVIISLRNGRSPVGYFYNPTVMCIVEWDKKDDFDKFTKKYPLETYTALDNIHQFSIQ